jgi:hypothetical protein
MHDGHGQSGPLKSGPMLSLTAHFSKIVKSRYALTFCSPLEFCGGARAVRAVHINRGAAHFGAGAISTLENCGSARSQIEN